MNLKRAHINKTIKTTEIGSPTDFKVIQHVGLSNDRQSFEVNLINIQFF